MAAATEPAAPPVPARLSLKSLREAAAGCTACPLYVDATQTVFGTGLKRAEVMLVGEQPGDREDQEGKPFVGPAGRELDEAFDRVGIGRSGGRKRPRPEGDRHRPPVVTP